MHILWFHCLLDNRIPHTFCPACCHRSRTIYATSDELEKAHPLPINYHIALSGKNCLARCDCPSSLVVDVCVETLRVAKPARCLSICHPQRKRPPSSNIVPQDVTPRNSQDWVCLAVPNSYELRRKARTDLPFPCLSTGSSDDARPPTNSFGGDGESCTHHTLRAKQHRHYGTCAPF